MTAVPTLSQRLELRYPIVCAPLFLISNVEMMVASARAGILGGVPALNYRSHNEFRGALKDIRTQTHLFFFKEKFGDTISSIVAQKSKHYRELQYLMID